MSQLDDELKSAIEKPVASPGGTPAIAAPATSPAFQRKRNLGLLIGLLAMGGAILFVVFNGIDNAAIYSKGVDQLLAEQGRLRMRNVRVLGHLVQGSLRRRSDPCEYRFRLTQGHEELEVHFPQCVIPDTLRDVPGAKVEVTAEGRLQADGTFLAHQILAKCPSKYDMKQKPNGGTGMPRSLGPATKLEAPRSDAPYALLPTAAANTVLTDH